MTSPGPAPRPVDPDEEITSFALHVGSARIVATVMRRPDGAFAVRLDSPSVVLDDTAIDGLHALLKRAGASMFEAELGLRGAGRRDA